MEAKGKPGPDELKLLEPFRDKLAPSVFDDPYTPPVSDGSGSDRKLLKQAYDLLLSAGCKRDGGTLMLPSGKPLTIEFLDLERRHAAAYDAVHRRISAGSAFRPICASSTPRSSRAAPKRSISTSWSRQFPDRRRQASALRVVFSSAAAAQNGSRNLAGVADPAVDALIEAIAAAKSREELNTACRALDRVLRAGHYWVPMWYRDTAWVAHWDAFSRPEKPAATRHRRAWNLVVGRSKGQDHWTLNRRLPLRPAETG